MYDICDLHSHILPGMDDGCATVDESLAVLQKMHSQGISRVFATPHYYARESVADFLQRRQDSCALLCNYARGMQLPEICCGAEVAWFAHLDAHPDIFKLCLGNSKYLLLELPFTPWSRQVMRDLDNLCLKGITPILAHYERYTHCQSKDALQKVLQADVLVQMNADTILETWKGFSARSAVKRGAVQLLGSDCHGLKRRPSRLAEAVALLEKKKCYGALEQIENLSNAIFSEAE